MDIFPIVRSIKPDFGYFGVPRSVLSYVDFFGALYCGYTGEMKGIRRDIANPDKARLFLKEVFGKVYQPYEEYGDILYEMYRHGTVHLYRPHTLINKDDRVLKWLTYKGNGRQRKGFMKYEDRVIYITHMIPQRYGYGNKQGVFPVDVKWLYKDLLAAVDIYQTRLEKDEDLRKKYSQVMVALDLPEKTNLY